MQEKNREIERKYLVDERWSLETLGHLVDSSLDLDGHEYVKIASCHTVDTYYAPPAASQIQFIRTRDSMGNMRDGEFRILKEVTIKQKDRGSNLNRLEINVQVGSVEAMKQVLELTLATARLGEIRKSEQVWFVKDAGHEVVISTCHIGKDLYIEVEGPSEELVTKYSEEFEQLIRLRRESRSLFEIYIEPNHQRAALGAVGI